MDSFEVFLERDKKLEKKFITYKYFSLYNYSSRCPICADYDLYRREKYCCWTNPTTLYGMLWWKRKCTIGGIHTHYKCRKCKANYVLIQQKNNSNFEEVLLK
jgi:hypothetical protein